MKKNILTEVNRMREIMGLITEQEKPKLELPFEKTFKAGYWKLSDEVKTEIDNITQKVKDFVTQHTGNIIKLTVNSGESQITNFDREQSPSVKVDPGYLSEKRNESIINYLKETYPNLFNNLIVEKNVVIGSTPYSKTEFASNCGAEGQNRDSEECKAFFKKYEPEQFINFTVEVIGDKKPETPITPSPLCNTKIAGKGKKGIVENDFISINKSMDTEGIPSEFTATVTSYSIPDRSQIYGIKNDGTRVLLMDTGYFGKPTSRDDNVGGLTYHYNQNPSSIAFQSTEMASVEIKTYDQPIELMRDVYKNLESVFNRLNNGYERVKDNENELQNFYKRYLNDVADNYPEEYSLWRLWESGVRTFVLFNDEERAVTKKFKIDDTYKQLQVVVYGPLTETISRIELNC